MKLVAALVTGLVPLFPPCMATVATAYSISVIASDRGLVGGTFPKPPTDKPYSQKLVNLSRFTMFHPFTHVCFAGQTVHRLRESPLVGGDLQF